MLANIPRMQAGVTPASAPADSSNTEGVGASYGRKFASAFAN